MVFVDGGAVNPDGGTLFVDGGAVNPDGGTVFVDGGAVNPDGGTVFVDGGTVNPDGGLVFVDGGTVNTDGGLVFVDGGAVDLDGGLVFVDGGGVPTLALTILPSVVTNHPGAVTSAEGLNCALGASTTGTGTCVVNVPPGSTVVLNATPPATAWAITGVDTSCIPGPTCQVRVNYDAEVRPSFGPAP
jgi:hypothetical protein